jgi:hypothetical protein
MNNGTGIDANIPEEFTEPLDRLSYGISGNLTIPCPPIVDSDLRMLKRADNILRFVVEVGRSWTLPLLIT